MGHDFNCKEDLGGFVRYSNEDYPESLCDLVVNDILKKEPEMEVVVSPQKPAFRNGRMIPYVRIFVRLT